MNLKLARAGSHTTSRSEKISVTLSPQTTDVAFDAVHMLRGSYTHGRCAVNHWVRNGTGTAHGWFNRAEGAVNCPGSQGYKKPRAGTAARAAQKFC